MGEKPTFDELQNRIKQSFSFFDVSRHHELAMTWDGYIGALLEWGLLSVSDHAKLRRMLPPNPDSPMLKIFLGFDSLD